ncbi:MAG: hypothetical protein KC491_04865 [Dehalococcoidia bacterium]|nr:hypothetical protein [Dehalococcoidia bacterium]
MALSDTDRQILGWLREGRQDAEIAVRLGLNVREARSRVERIRRELGARDRAELAASKPGGESAMGEGARSRRSETVLPDAEPLRGSGRTFSRRTVLLAGTAGAAATVAAGLGVFALARDADKGAPPLTPDATGTSAPTPTASAIATATSHPGADALVRQGGLWNRMTVPSGEVLPYAHGVCFLDIETGVMDVISAAPPANIAYGGEYRLSLGRSVLVALNGAHNDPNSWGQILNRETGASATWDPNVLGLRVHTDRVALFEKRLPEEDFAADPGRFYAFDANLELVRELDLSAYPGFGQTGVAVSNDGLVLFGVMSADTGRPGPVIVDIESGAAGLAEQPPWAGDTYALLALEPWGDDGARGVWQRRPPEPGIVAEEYEAFVGAWSADGSLLHSELTTLGAAIQGNSWGGSEPVSPDGRYRISVDSFAWSWTGSIGGHEDWLYTTCEAVDGSSAFRVLSGNLHYGFGEHRRWLADSSAFIVESGIDGSQRDDYFHWTMQRRYYLVSPGDGSMELLPAIPTQFWGELDERPIDWRMGPEPSPDDADLLAFGRTLLYNRRTGRWLGPKDPPTGSWLDPWDSGAVGARKSIRFAWPLPGKDSSYPVTILPPLVEKLWFREAATFVVADTGACLNLRVAPDAEAEVIRCLPDGASLVLLEPPRDSPHLSGIPLEREARVPSFWGEDGAPFPEQGYVYVRADDGTTGWVALQYLEWAPDEAHG